MAQYTRRNVWELETQDPNGPWDPYTVAYAKAVQVMMARADDDPTSWTYQAAMHGSYTTPALDLWNQCQHGTWYFLPWHRMYVHFFERIVRAIVLEQGGPEDWALPFWNYSDPDTTRAAMPPAFREPTWDPDGNGPQPNPLYTTHRAPAYNGGEQLPGSATSLACLSSNNFTGFPLPGFGGVVTGFSHDGRGFGLLEQVPHNIVHVLVGGDEVDPCQAGWMCDPNCAAEDPIFWMHHSNIDRLWSVWNDAGHGNPDRNPVWADFPFEFYDETGTKQTMRPSEVSSLTEMDYTYEPQPEPPAREGVRMSGPPTDQPEGESRPAPRLLAASEDGVALTGGRTDVAVPLAGPATEGLRAAADPGDDSTKYVYLNVEGLTAEHTPGLGWEVHLNLPADAPGGGGDRLVGIITLFGFKDTGGEHGIGPLDHTFDITGLVAGLRDRGEWDEIAATVSFLPVGPSDTPEGEVHGRPRVSRVSISAH
jgi:hypothetical protein